MRCSMLIFGAVLVSLLTQTTSSQASVYLNESNVTSLSGSATIMHLDGASPATGPNAVWLGGNNPADPGDVTWVIHLVPGKRYRMTSRRHVASYPNRDPHFSYKIDIDGQLFMQDWACTRNNSEDDKYVNKTFLGYYTPASTTTTVRAYAGDWWGARIDYIRFDPTDDVFLDENTPNLTFMGSDSNASLKLFDFSPDLVFQKFLPHIGLKAESLLPGAAIVIVTLLGFSSNRCAALPATKQPAKNIILERFIFSNDAAPSHNPLHAVEKFL